MKRRLFLNSRVFRQILILLGVAGLVPALILTYMTYVSFQEQANKYNLEKLQAANHEYGLNVLDHLQFAESMLLSVSQQHAHKHTSIEFGHLRPLFSRIGVMTTSGESVKQAGFGQQLNGLESDFIAAELKTHKHASFISVYRQAHSGPALFLVNRSFASGNQIWVGELNPKFLWGVSDGREYDIDYCVSDHLNTPLFCSNTIGLQYPRSDSPVVTWELFLKHEFESEPWTIKTRYRYPVKTSQSFFSANLLRIVLLVLLLAGLMSLVQIRHVLVPLRALSEASKKIVLGQYPQVQVSGKDEFAELGHAFNNMSHHLQRQRESTEVLTSIDQEISTGLNLDLVVHKIMARIIALIPDGRCLITLLTESPKGQITYLKESEQGELRILENGYSEAAIAQIDDVSNEGVFELHEAVKTELAAQLGWGTMGSRQWLCPVYWQGRLCAFLVVIDDKPLAVETQVWEEIKKLADRLGVAVSARGREQQLIQQAHYDSLTSLPNRVLLQERLQQALESASQHDHPVWVLFIDLDRFKLVNDSLGHKAGDQLLQQATQRIKSLLNKSATLARLGGDEFVLVLPEISEEGAKLSLMQNIMQALSVPFMIDEQKIFLSCSIGVAISGADADSPEKLIECADIAMYRAKQSGRNRYQFYTPSMNVRAVERLQMLSDLRVAVEREQFELYYQPKVSLQTGNIVGAEALIRWHHPARGMVPPLQFIPLAEESGLIAPIGEWALHKACQQAAQWQRSGFEGLKISVNVSLSQFNLGDLKKIVENALAQSGLKSTFLELEITESIFSSNLATTIGVLNHLHHQGVGLSIDDFGTGYSSLSYLGSMPVDTLKIDKSFTDAIRENSQDYKLFDAVFGLAQSLGFVVVVEGVETAFQAHYLKQKQCEQIQGYLFSKPVPAAEFTAMLVSGKRLELLPQNDQPLTA
jgi:diguanylate cyclase (GGDEF)-like protein